MLLLLLLLLYDGVDLIDIDLIDIVVMCGETCREGSEFEGKRGISGRRRIKKGRKKGAKRRRNTTNKRIQARTHTHKRTRTDTHTHTHLDIKTL
jgi:hypothetical protein